LPQGRSAPNKGDTKEVTEALKADLANIFPHFSVRQQILAQLVEFCNCYSSLKTHPFAMKSIPRCTVE
jgi:hypothetical protein